MDPAAASQKPSFRRMPLPKALRLFWTGTIAISVLTLIVSTIEWKLGFPLLRYNPLAEAPFGDLTEYLGTFRYVHTPAFFSNPTTPAVAYPPFGAVLYAFTYLFAKPVLAYFIIAAAWLVACIVLVRRALLKRGIAPATATLFPLTTVLLSFPIAGLLERANIELYLWIFAALGVWAMLRGRDSLAAVLWGLAAAVKLYPLIFFALLIPRRRYGALAIGVATFIGASVLSMLYLCPSLPVGWHGSLHNVFGYQGIRATQWNVHELAANHSLFTFAKFIGFIAGISPGRLTLPYYALGALVFALSFFGRLRKLPVTNHLLAVSAFMVMLPSVSYFYALVHLYAPVVLLALVAVDAQRDAIELPGLKGAMLLFVPLFASYMLFTFPAKMLYGGLFQGFLLLLLFFFANAYPFPCRSFGESTEELA